MAETYVSVENLHIGFNGTPVLNGMNMNVSKSEVFVILGPSGCGKSVLLKNIIGLLKPQTGTVTVNGKNVTSMNEAQLNLMRENVGMVFQGSALLNSLSVIDNVALPLRERGKMSEQEIITKCKEKLALVGLSGAESKMPGELSGGMKKRVAIARVLAVEPQLILYDEPTVGLDPILAEGVDELIIELKNKLGVTSLVVTHDIESAFKLADRVAMMNNGEFNFVGTVDECKASTDPIVKRFIKRALLVN